MVKLLKKMLAILETIIYTITCCGIDSDEA